MKNNSEQEDEINTSAKQFPLVHKLIKFADLRQNYSDMRQALKKANSKSGGYKSWITRWKNRYHKANLEIQKLEIEKKQLWQDKKELSDQIKEISQKYQSMGSTYKKLRDFENAVDQLRDIKLSIDDQVTSAGTWTSNSMVDLKTAVENFLEAVDEIINEE